MVLTQETNVEIHVQFVLSLQPEVNLQNQKWEVWKNIKKNKPEQERDTTFPFIFLPRSASLAFAYTTEAAKT